MLAEARVTDRVDAAMDAVEQASLDAVPDAAG
jgi:hypothetical protein